jgi:Fe-S cluster assembly ATP-binding protein
MDPTFLNRNVNQGFSGGEKKRNEILQLACLEVRPGQGRAGAG